MVPKAASGATLDWAFVTIEPPQPKQIPSPRTFHGDTVIDEYAWLADKDDPDTIGYLKAESSVAPPAAFGTMERCEDICC